MSRLELRPFAEDHIDAAGALLAARHREHRAVERLLAERFEDAGETRAEVSSLWAEEHASGAVALRDGQVVGFLLGTQKDVRTWGANVWVEAAGYAAEDAEVVRDLYAFSAQRWFDEGRTRHYALVPRLDEHIEAWFRLSFGVQQAHGIQEVHAHAWPPHTRRAEPSDLEAMIALAPLVSDHHELAPVFSGIAWDEDADELRSMLAADIADAAVGELVYEQDGHPVAGFELAPVDRVAMHRGLAQPDAAVCITWGASLPEVRRSGAGVALMGAAQAWAHEQGFGAVVTDWRETNLLASRFWPARGFRPSFLRLYRSIP